MNIRYYGILLAKIIPSYESQAAFNKTSRLYIYGMKIFLLIISCTLKW